MKVYIAGPYTKGDVALNVRAAIEAGNELLDAGHQPFVPHLTHFWHMLFPQPYEKWIALDLVWLPHCEALIRLPGKSSGADGEVQAARKLGLAIFDSTEEFLDWAENS